MRSPLTPAPIPAPPTRKVTRELTQKAHRRTLAKAATRKVADSHFPHARCAYFVSGVGYRTNMMFRKPYQGVFGSARVETMSAENTEGIAHSLLRKQAADALRRARKLPVGYARNDLRQLAIGLRWLEKRELSEKTRRAVIETFEIGSDRGRHV